MSNTTRPKLSMRAIEATQNLSERITWPVAVLFAATAACVAWTIVHLPLEAQLALARDPLSMTTAIGALMMTAMGFFRGPLVKPKTSAPPSYSQMPPTMSVPPNPLPSEYAQARPSMPPKEQS